MKSSTAVKAQCHAEAQSGQSLYFELCRTDYFSDQEAYGLRVVGETLQSGTATVSKPAAIRRVAKGSKIICGDEITTPCDLYEGDIWYPTRGMVERHNYIFTPAISTGSYSVLGDSGSNIPYIVFNLPVTANEYYDFSRALCNAAGVNTTISTSNSQVGFRALYSSTYHDNRILFRAASQGTNSNAMYEILQSLNSNGTPLTFVLGLLAPLTEQYTPVKPVAPLGTVSITQVPLDLSADLSTSMLILNT